MGFVEVILERFLSLSIPFFAVLVLVCGLIARLHWRLYAVMAVLLVGQLALLGYADQLSYVPNNENTWGWLMTQLQWPALSGWLALVISGMLAAYLWLSPRTDK